MALLVRYWSGRRSHLVFLKRGYSYGRSSAKIAQLQSTRSRECSFDMYLNHGPDSHDVLELTALRQPPVSPRTREDGNSAPPYEIRKMDTCNMLQKSYISHIYIYSLNRYDRSEQKENTTKTPVTHPASLNINRRCGTLSSTMAK